MIYKFIIFICLILLVRYLYLKYYRKKHKSKELFNVKKKFLNDIKKINIIYLKNNEACDILTNENNERYISDFTKEEMKSKYCLDTADYKTTHYSQQRLIDECKLNYCKNVLEFLDNEKIAINSLVQTISYNIKEHYPKFLFTKWKFIKIDDRIESGLPHTRKDCIILPRSYVNNITKHYEKKNNHILLTEYGSLIIHEQTHIMQRNNPEIFLDLYTKIWPFKKSKNLKFINKMNYKRSNPDAINPEWVYHTDSTNGFLPISKLNPDLNFDLRYPNKLAYPVKRIKENYYVKKNQQPKNLNSIVEYYNKFCNIQQNYHPNEISAVFLAKIFTYKFGYIILPDEELKCLDSFIKWLDSKFKI